MIEKAGTGQAGYGKKKYERAQKGGPVRIDREPGTGSSRRRRNTSCWLHEFSFSEIGVITHVLLYMNVKWEKITQYSPLK